MTGAYLPERVVLISRNMHVAEAKLWEHLKNLGADVRIINLPYDAEAKGIDDFFVKHGEAAKEKFEGLIEKATPTPLGYTNICFQRKHKEEIPHYLAEFIRHEYFVINTKSGFHTYQAGCYKLVPDEYLKNIAAECLKKAGVVPKPHYLNETIKLLSAYCLVDEDKFNPSDMHNVSNGTLKLNLNDGNITFEKHSHKNYFNYMAEAEYLPEIGTGQAHEYLNSIIPDKNQQIISQEGSAVAIFPSLRKKLEYVKITLEFGEGKNGKTIYTDLRRKMIGKEVCSSVSIDQIAGKENRFVASTLYKRKANFSTETERSFIKESSILKQISSGKPGDELSIEFKHKQAFFGLVNPVLTFAINKQPALPANRSFALERRFQVINYPNKFSKNPKEGEVQADERLENPEYTKPILNSLLLLVTEAVQSMLKRGHIWQEGVEETLKQAILKGSHKEQFFEENIEFDKLCEISSQELHNFYATFCVEEGYAEERQYKNGSTKVIWSNEEHDKACKTPTALIRWVKQRFKKEVSDIYVYTSERKRVRGLSGLRLKNKNVEDEVFNCSAPNNAEISPNNPLNTCTDKVQDSFEKKLKPEFLEKLKDKNATEHL